jgi:hypothetical protein
VKQAYEFAAARGYMELCEREKPAQRVPIGGVGFVFDAQRDADGLVLGGVDFDKVIHERDIASLAAARIQRLGSYTEQSVSGAGLHVILKAHPLATGIVYSGVEMYTSGRYFTMTGRAPANARIVAAPEAFAALADELQPAATCHSHRVSSAGPTKATLATWDRSHARSYIDAGCSRRALENDMAARMRSSMCVRSAVTSCSRLWRSPEGSIFEC